MNPDDLLTLAWLEHRNTGPFATGSVLAEMTTLGSLLGVGAPAVAAALLRLESAEFIDVHNPHELELQDMPSVQVLEKGVALVRRVRDEGVGVTAVLGAYPHTLHRYRVAVTYLMGRPRAQIQALADTPLITSSLVSAGTMVELIQAVMGEVRNANPGCNRFEITFL